ncbi:hypothetical protein HYS84_03185 [Candidatus Saccharibacteria bacterium]|nr:hypothetical protein [Candidatus Saccharibacteria bacterium]
MVDAQIQDNSKEQLAHITQEMYVKNMELASTNRTLSLLRAIDLLVLNSHGSLKELSTKICQAIEESLSCTAVTVLARNTLSDKILHFQGWSVNRDIYNAVGAYNLEARFETLEITLNSPWLLGDEKTLIIDATRATQEIHPDPTNHFIQDLARGLGIKSFYLTKLRAQNNLVGVMGIGLSEETPKLDDIGLYERLSEAVGIALDNKLLFDENQRVAKELEESNRKLKELDKSKDEFISMASHQLRTPLTAIKGYLSMVLEGDVGPVTEQEKTMIKRAYDGAQKMVYLIADLLNVSRLQSGRLIIENKPTDLSGLVEGEIAQLQETAAHHKIKLIYQKPSSFPTLMLDENKLRQVVMNFLDNALHYTSDGGTVTAVLQAIDENVNFTVTDTGVGVPKEVQPHLFAKFYRADNARKIRPDGTGLGLFMAKKVIDAQGGTILFQSEEGKGSTFGFRFPLKQVQSSTLSPPA